MRASTLINLIIEQRPMYCYNTETSPIGNNTFLAPANLHSYIYDPLPSLRNGFASSGMIFAGPERMTGNMSTICRAYFTGYFLKSVGEGLLEGEIYAIVFFEALHNIIRRQGAA